MFKSLKLYNFQAHKKLLLQLDPRITTIKGRTDAGKSAILRALRWICLNDIGGEDFITWGQKEAVAILEVDGHKVVRRKGAENVYKLNGSVFKAFGAGKVPDVIEEVLNVNEINFQKQHDVPFWLGEKNAGEVSRQLNAIIDLSVIDTATSNAGKMVRTARERVVVSEDRLGDKRRKLAEVLLETDRIEKFNLIQAKFQKYESAKKDHDHLEAIIKLVDSCDVEALEGKAERARILFEKASRLRDVTSAHSRLSGLIQDLELADEWAVEVPDIGKLSAAWYGLKKVTAQIELLSELVKQLDLLENVAGQHEVYADECKKLMEEHACPTCGRKR